MIKEVDNCVQCWESGLLCRGDACPNSRPAYVRCCDNCECDDAQLYHFEGKELCIDCIEESLEKIED